MNDINTEDARRLYALGWFLCDDPPGEDPPGEDPHLEFDSWLCKVQAKAWDEGARDAIMIDPDFEAPANPYLESYAE